MTVPKARLLAISAALLTPHFANAQVAARTDSQAGEIVARAGSKVELYASGAERADFLGNESEVVALHIGGAGGSAFDHD